ncbi:carboxylate--amine ligase [Gordonia iterans]|uniref:Carboxylate--amine ligase n=1 Tax=Gordonia iterans TaxID=1004901 RepID=A0A2S0KGI8_9ACTN|nr:PAC2 family protein [Gordonia iterans]AVM00798.1 carboxylate--amine ligase [Gordonia iterans]
MTGEPRDALPTLRRPILLAAFGGWNDAGDAASAAIEHLSLTWDAAELYEIDPDEYYDYQSSRPVVHQSDGVARRLEWPSTGISYCRIPSAPHDLVLVLGLEPNLRWRAFCREIVDVALALDVELSIVLGSLLADTPHTRPVPISGAAHDADSAKRYGLSKAQYEGPTGITGVLQDAFIQAGVPAVALWASVPHYIGHPPNPKATLALLRRLEDVTGLSIPVGVLPEQAVQWEETISEMMSEDEDMAGYVRELEQREDDDPPPHAPLTEVDGDTLAAEFEKYLRRRSE